MAVFGYVRVSTERQADEGVSLDEQKRRIAFAEFERNRISERIRDAKRHLKRNGQYLGGVRPFGWRVGANGELEPPAPRCQSVVARPGR
jgi:DNA invertase Pin-like site-specific DNA recombinase